MDLRLRRRLPGLAIVTRWSTSRRYWRPVTFGGLASSLVAWYPSSQGCYYVGIQVTRIAAARCRCTHRLSPPTGSPHHPHPHRDGQVAAGNRGTDRGDHLLPVAQTHPRIVAADRVARAGIGARYIWRYGRKYHRRVAWRTRIIAGCYHRRRIQVTRTAARCRCSHRLVYQLTAAASSTSVTVMVSAAGNRKGPNRTSVCAVLTARWLSSPLMEYVAPVLAPVTFMV